MSWIEELIKLSLPEKKDKSNKKEDTTSHMRRGSLPHKKQKNIIQGVQVFTQGGISGAYWYLDKIKPKDEDQAETIFPVLLNVLCDYFNSAEEEDSLGEIQRISINTRDYWVLLEIYSNDKGSKATILRERIGKDWNTSITDYLAYGLLSSYEAIKKDLGSSIKPITANENWQKLIDPKIRAIDIYLEDYTVKQKMYEGYKPIIKYTFVGSEFEGSRDEKIKKISSKLLKELTELLTDMQYYEHKNKIKRALNKIQDISNGEYNAIDSI
ncbi:MAG: hypothetical protein ACXAEU_11000 [Candidatus Hodarchaeales archaeon]|jgi:hypothetical protein